MYVALGKWYLDVALSKNTFYREVYSAANLRMLVRLVYPDTHLQIERGVSKSAEVDPGLGAGQYIVHRPSRFNQGVRHLVQIASVCDADRDVESHFMGGVGVVYYFVLKQLRVWHDDRHVFVR